jgi:hypothetical protein
MPTDIRIVHAHDFIKVTPEGQLDLKKSEKLLLEVASVAADLVEYEIILDYRKAQMEMSVTDLWYLAAALSNLRRTFSRNKTAVLCPPDRFDNAEFFAICAQNRGFQVMPFTSFEDAIEWLITNGT